MILAYFCSQVRTSAYGTDMESSLMERYVRSQAAGPAAAYHTKAVIAASGLTVDLPSPDSGIGADTITPRDPTAIHQVRQGENVGYFTILMIVWTFFHDVFGLVLHKY